MDKDDRYTRITLRIPKDLHELLGRHAEDTSKSMNAEIIARLEETFEIEEVLESIAPGAPISGTAGLIAEIAGDLDESRKGNSFNAVAAAADEIVDALAELRALPYLAATLALQTAHPNALTDSQKDRLTKVVARMIGSESDDPVELLNALSDRLLEQALQRDLGL